MVTLKDKVTFDKSITLYITKNNFNTFKAFINVNVHFNIYQVIDY